MINIAGIEIEKNAKGQDTYIRIDLKKYKKQLQPFLQSIGVIQDNDNFEKEWEDAITKNELIKRVTKHIETLP